MNAYRMPPACLVAVLAVATGWLAPLNANAQQNYPARPVHLIVPYQSGPQATTAIVAGEVQILQIGTGQSVPMVRTGKLKAIAVTNNARSSFIPEVPTFKEGGLDWAVTPWNGVFAPMATPSEIVRRLNAEINGLPADPGFKARVLAGSIIEAAGGSPEEFAAFLKSDRKRFAEVAKRAAIRLD